MKKPQTLFDPSLLNSSKRSAIFSEDRKYRYLLERNWQDTLKPIAFIGLNPSTANEEENDPTIRRVINFAKRWGYGGVRMYNLFAIVSSKPEILSTGVDLQGDNDHYLSQINITCRDVVFAWGNFKQATERSKVVTAMFPDAICLKKNKNGTPIHPLYVPGSTIPIKFKTQQ